MIGVAMMVDDPRSGAQAAPCYRLTDKRNGEEYELNAERVVRAVGVKLCFIDWAIRVDGAFEKGVWRVDAIQSA